MTYHLDNGIDAVGVMNDAEDSPVLVV